MKIHKLKIDSQNFLLIALGEKTFEICKNDLNFKVNDKIVLQEFDSEKQKYTGGEMTVYVTYVTNYQQKDGYAVLAIKPEIGTTTDPITEVF